MKPALFAYRAPATVAAAITEVSASDARRILAGGQSLVPMLNLRLVTAEALVDISRIAALREVTQTPTAVRYGALTTHAAFEDGRVPDATNGLMRHVGAGIAFRAVRTRGTIGGALALADPAADWVTTAIALQAILHIEGGGGRTRTVPAESFVLGPYYTALEPNEILTAVEVPRLAPSTRWGHYKVVRKAGEYADSMAIALLDRGERRARIVLGAVEGAPIVLARTAVAMLGATDPTALTALCCDELRASGREFSAAQFARHVTTVVRAAAQVIDR